MTPFCQITRAPPLGSMLLSHGLTVRSEALSQIGKVVSGLISRFAMPAWSTLTALQIRAERGALNQGGLHSKAVP